MLRQLQLSFLAVLFLATFSCNEGTGKILQYDLKKEETSFVVIQLKDQPRDQEALNTEKEIKAVADQIKAINAKLGYIEFAKKLAFFNMDSEEGSTPYLVIRNFEDFKAAEIYSKAIEKEITGNIFGEIGDPFPISQSNYTSCVEDKNFKPYFEFYTKSRR